MIQRIGRRGLASATSSPYLLVMDSDLQHGERIIPVMLEKLKRENLDIVIGSRNVSGGGVGEFAANRDGLSNMGRRLSDAICKVPITNPMSGFFLLTREYFHQVVHNLSNVGFKILVDLLASARRPVRREVPYTFRQREHGASKLDILVGIEYLQLLLDKMTGGLVPVSYLLFGMVGSVGMVCNVVLAILLVQFAHAGFREAQLIGALITAINFLLNNQVTFRFRAAAGYAAAAGPEPLLCLLLDWAAGTSFAGIFAAPCGGELDRSDAGGCAGGFGFGTTMAFLLVWHIRRRRTDRLQFAYAEPGWLQEPPKSQTTWVFPAVRSGGCGVANNRENLGDYRRGDGRAGRWSRAALRERPRSVPPHEGESSPGTCFKCAVRALRVGYLKRSVSRISRWSVF